jgi:hypothetical protein
MGSTRIGMGNCRRGWSREVRIVGEPDAGGACVNENV